MNGLALPPLYESIDISIHNDVGLFNGYHPLYRVTAESPERNIMDIETSFLSKQKLFVDAVLRTPRYGKLVRSFTWTCLTELDDDDKPIGERRTWMALRKLDSVESLDFASMMSERERHPPPQLFRSARQVCLVGRMSQAMVSALLHCGNPQRFIALDLDNIWDFGQLDVHKALPKSSEHVLQESYRRNGRPKTRNYGPMRSHLHLINGKCTFLTRLSLRGVGQDYLGRSHGWHDEFDEQRYAEWASFLDSVKSTLQYLLLEQGRKPGYNQPMCTTIRITMPRQATRPMDERFLKYLFPVLERGPWPQLRSMTIRGLLGGVRYEYERLHAPASSDSFDRIALQLRRALGDTVELKVEREAEKTYWHREHSYEV